MSPPEDHFKRIHQRKLVSKYKKQIHNGRLERLLGKQLRKCPSCAKDAIVIEYGDSRVGVRCKDCGLTFDTRYCPAFGDIDYYNQMLDWFRSQARKGYVPVIEAGLDHIPELVIMNCPTCGSGKLVVKRSRYGHRFVGCTNYRTLGYTTGFQLPRLRHIKRSRIVLSDLKCPSYSWPMLEWNWEDKVLAGPLCFNSECKRNWQKPRNLIEGENDSNKDLAVMS